MTGGLKDGMRAAVTPRMIALLILMLAAIALCLRLGYWQLERATSRGADRIAQAHEEKIHSDVVPLGDVLAMQETMTRTEFARPVYAVGTFGDQLRVTGRGVEGEDADLVLTRLDTPAGVVPVVRGYVSPGAPLPDPPGGEVTVAGYLGGPEASSATPKDGVASAISPAELVNVWGGPILSGYLVQFTVPAGHEDEVASGLPLHIPMEERLTRDGPPPHLPAPGVGEEGGFNLQNAAYAAEWVIFAGFFAFLYVRQLRVEALRRREDRLLDEIADKLTDQPSFTDER
ncbi:MAG: SURF1 family protein [Flaviflexus sp.]|nr:SURF1 family protein [Flaviflexus sp.]